MLTTSDAELLRQYARNKSEAAFGEIVRRYANLVYSAARRQTDDVEEAHDVAQMVFVDLAQKAGSISPKSLLAGWLYRGVRLQALEWRRNHQRRQQRERLAMDSLDSSSEACGEWTAVQPLLDDAMASLPDKDRDALLLRFFKNESLANVGGTLGISEDAAQKRVSRAIGKLREFLAQRGITTTEAALSATLAANAVEMASGGAAALWVSGALAGAPLSAPSLLTLFNMKTAFIIAALAGSLVVLTVLQVRSAREVDALQAALKSQAEDLAAARAQIEQLNTRPTVAADDSPTREIARLRARIDRLRSDLAAEKAHSATGAKPGETAESPTNAERFPAQITIECVCLTGPASGLYGTLTGLMPAVNAFAMVDAATNNAELNRIASPRVTTLCGRQARIEVEDTVPFGAGSTNVGLSLDVLPECSSDSENISLQFSFRATRVTAQSGIEEISTNTTLNVPDGDALVLTMGIPGTGPWFGGDPTNSESARALLILLAPTLIDRAGNRLHPAPTNSVSQSVTANPSGIFPGPSAPPSN
jgi:RNA polymerase sigma factor (sigma-70 family)